jgi:hypothetical protein
MKSFLGFLLVCCLVPTMTACDVTVVSEDGEVYAGGEDLDSSCSVDAPCGPGLYCDYSDESCGKYGSEGVCREPTEPPGETPRLVCTCEGVMDLCDRDVDRARTSFCETPAGSIACGTVYCDAATEYCLEDPGCNEPSSYRCQPIPEECLAALSCECLEDEEQLPSCSGGAESGFELRSYAPHGEGCP